MSDDIDIIPEAAKRKFRQFLDARAKADEAEAALKRAKEDRDNLEQEVWAALVDAVGSASLPVDLGPPYGTVRLGAVETIYANIINEDKLMEYLENSAQIDEYTRPTLAKGELNALARRLKESNQPFPSGLDYRPTRYVRVTKQKAK